MTQDWMRPFSQYHAVRQVVGDRQVITDVFGLSYLSAVYDSYYYCIETRKKERVFVLGPELLKEITSPHRYTRGIETYMKEQSLDTVFLFTINSPSKMAPLTEEFRVSVVESREQSIEKFSNIFLYKIRRKFTDATLYEAGK
jgi:hypothetical protein